MDGGVVLVVGSCGGGRGRRERGGGRGRVEELVDVAEGLVEFAADGRIEVCGCGTLLLLLLLTDTGIQGEVGMGLEGPRGSGRFGARGRVEFRGAGCGTGELFQFDEALFLLRAEAAEESAGGGDHDAGGGLVGGGGEVDGVAVGEAEAVVVGEEDLAVEVEEVGGCDVVPVVDARDVVEEVEEGGRGEVAVSLEVGDDGSGGQGALLSGVVDGGR